MRVASGTVSEWLEWHRGYDTGRGLAGRLREVQRRIGDALDGRPPGSISIISMCAGDGRDLLGVLPSHPRRGDVRARLVELEPELVARGRARIAECGCSVEMVLGDASTTGAYAGAVPADIVLVCGVFGNITDADVRATIAHLPHLCAADATVVWTRGRFEPDLTPAIRRWFEDSGFAEVAFVAIPDGTESVGVHRLTTAPRPFQPGVQLFTFLERADRPSSQGGAGS
jgi:hypothetical protein